MRGKQIGVIGFNARPIACSLKQLGATVFVSDYWGDDDLSACCDEWVSVLNPRPGQRQRSSLNAPVHELLVQNFLVSFGTDFDYVILGSGFDDHADAVQYLESMVSILGNHSLAFRRARNRNVLISVAKDLGLRIPKAQVVSSLDSILDAANTVGFPCVVRRTTSGGGGGIHFVKDEQSLLETVAFLHDKNTQDKCREFIIQEYINGIDCSATIIGNGIDAKLISIQGQLVGMPVAGRNCDFVYCGNYYPCPKGISIDESAFISLCNNLGLIGYNGIDFVVDQDGRVWIMEINPRITGTLELLERSSTDNLVYSHILACEHQLLPSQLRLRPAVKMIVYSRWDGIVPDLRTFEGTVDRTPAGVAVRQGDPVCTVITVSSSLLNAYSAAVDSVQSVIANVKRQCID